ncbi:putative myo-inositol 2-dehydrogenase [Microlunatus phosphovorus NM-1]|uniref:Putative myo-inositol 2-dehydrogenase n=1 Tax=Microlunatus phosphovorus (strain ATCC 700054 / DSM 10555 / JCM 9379 / NBRC 101784 / NCIMB 13414 / VKM Ac-1990 / NM-1) TaxID=1032480 RepID=F5XN51_MICPN|nr:Gfo/Idh/MocA family oxidoreductase [Microlunatus phosphovorus]BAK36501.1 putative myo-inositol 2-dehydrogenase [Microlunatus phosphovorus NM-1]
MSLWIGLIGAGGIAREHLSAWRSLGVEVSVFSHAGAAGLIAELGGTEVATLSELLGCADVVDIATPTPTHGDLALAALHAGLPVVCEKPLARTAAEAERVIEAFEAADLPLYPGHVVRYFSEYAAARAAVSAGAIGEVAVQRFTRTGSAPTAAWFHDDAQSGGIVLDQCLHDLDFARWTAGEVATAYAQESMAGGVRSVQVLLAHRSGALSNVCGTWARPGTRFRTTFDIAGTGGVLTHDSAEHPLLQTDFGDQPVAGTGRGLLPAMAYESPFQTELGEFLAALRGGPLPRVGARDGLAAIRIAEAAQCSLVSGQAEPVAGTEVAR